MKPRRKTTRGETGTPVSPSSDATAAEPPGSSARWFNSWLVFAIIAVAIVFCFLPLMGFFFAQDDFVLIHRSITDPGHWLGKFFGPVAHHFRPLTKVVYFSITYPIFGLHALPYHLVSMVVHLLNTLLVYLILRRLRISAAPALISTAFFGLSVAFFHIVGWISTIQQSGGQLFFLLTIHLAIGAIRDRSTRKHVFSVLAYILALLSIEQTFAVPVLIFLIAVFGLLDERVSLRRAIKTLWPHIVILIAYVVMRIFWKGLPTGGVSKFVYGRNILENLSAYLGALFDFRATIGGLITEHPLDRTTSHLLLVALVAYNLVRLRFREVTVALLFIFAGLFPALFLVRHYFFYHTYVPAFGAVYLLALVIEDAFALLGAIGLHTARRQLVVALLVILALGASSYQKVRENIRLSLEGRHGEGSFVLRRSLVAENLYRSLEAKVGDMTGVERVYLLYGRPGQRTSGGRHAGVRMALGDGKCADLIFRRYGAEVVWQADTRVSDLQGERSRVFFYDSSGTCYTYAEVMTQRGL